MYQNLSATVAKNHDHLDNAGIEQLIKVKQDDMRDTAGYGDHDLSAFHREYAAELQRLLEHRETMAEQNNA